MLFPACGPSVIVALTRIMGLPDLEVFASASLMMNWYSPSGGRSNSSPAAEMKSSQVSSAIRLSSSRFGRSRENGTHDVREVRIVVDALCEPVFEVRSGYVRRMRLHERAEHA